MSSSHLFFGLPIALFILYLELRSGFHSAAFLKHFAHSTWDSSGLLHVVRISPFNQPKERGESHSLVTRFSYFSACVLFLKMSGDIVTLRTVQACRENTWSLKP